jgi:hypothetical protein
MFYTKFYKKLSKRGLTKPPKYDIIVSEREVITNEQNGKNQNGTADD